MASPKPIPTAIAKIGPDTSKGKRKLSVLLSSFLDKAGDDQVEKVVGFRI